MDEVQASEYCFHWLVYLFAVDGVRPDDELEEEEIQSLLKTAANKIHQAPNRVRYAMNGFVIAAGTYFQPVLPAAKAAASTIGKVHVDVGATACKVPLATATIEKVESMGRIGKKRKTTKC